MIITRLIHKPYWLMALISGLLIGLSYPYFRLGFLAWFGFIPLIHIWLNSRPASAFKWGFFASITANLISLYWIGFNSGAGFWPVLLSLIAAILYLGIYWAGLGALVSWVEQKSQKGLLVLPFAWVLMEWIRGLGPLGFPWINLALTQSSYLPLVQIIEITGSLGVGFWIILLNTWLYQWAINEFHEKKWMIYAGSILLVMWVGGSIRYRQIENNLGGKEIKIAVVQPNIDPNQKWGREYRRQNIDLMVNYLKEALDMIPDLVLWPETAVPAYLRLSHSIRNPIQKLVHEANIPLLSGTVDRIIRENGEKDYYNGTILIHPDKTLDMYYKIHLVPFAEYIPLSDKFPSLLKLNFGQGNFKQGTEFTVFSVDSLKFSNVICYESSIPGVVSEFVRAGAQFLTIQANDGWLGNTTGPYQHFELAKLRAIENRIPVIRAANTGISGYITPSGRVGKRIPLGTSSVFLVNFNLTETETIYTRYGNIFAGLCFLILSCIVGLIWRK